MLPILGTGAAGFDFETGAQIVCETVLAYDPSTLRDCRVIAYSDREYGTVQSIAERLRST